MNNHKFKIGQSVNYTSGPVRSGSGRGVYKIMHFKSAAEPHERMVKESQLNPV